MCVCARRFVPHGRLGLWSRPGGWSESSLAFEGEVSPPPAKPRLCSPRPTWSHCSLGLPKRDPPTPLVGCKGGVPAETPVFLKLARRASRGLPSSRVLEASPSFRKGNMDRAQSLARSPWPCQSCLTPLGFMPIGLDTEVLIGGQGSSFPGWNFGRRDQIGPLKPGKVPPSL